MEGKRTLNAVELRHMFGQSSANVTVSLKSKITETIDKNSLNEGQNYAKKKIKGTHPPKKRKKKGKPPQISGKTTPSY